MKRIGILTAGGDTPALNATIKGAVVRANQCRVEVFGFIKGFSSLLFPHVPHVRLNPLFSEIPELDATMGGTVLGASRAFVDSRDTPSLDQVAERMRRLGIEGLICIGGDGTLNGMQPLADRFPMVLAPKTIDNDLGLNYRSEPDEWVREPSPAEPGFTYKRGHARTGVRPRQHDQLRDAGLRHGGVRLGRGRPPHPHHGREPSPHRDHRGDGPALGLHRPGHRLRPARHHPGAGASAQRGRPDGAGLGALRAAEERRDRLRRGYRGRGRPGAGCAQVTATTRPAT